MYKNEPGGGLFIDDHRRYTANEFLTEVLVTATHSGKWRDTVRGKPDILPHFASESEQTRAYPCLPPISRILLFISQHVSLPFALQTAVGFSSVTAILAGTAERISGIFSYRGISRIRGKL
ncbi:hypothetical protein ElyMa_000525600 [Elysia marginata]|uniref:Uncharacterized protein n=1 Tax=Elysia marginata TaxID=1093978 RepID=A0AAV4G0B6_9GAST|nr:hypothetical protein ElyMa_000525600 [Elysia marginata]